MSSSRAISNRPRTSESQAKIGRDFARAQNGFRSECGIVIDHQIFQVESGSRQQSHMNRTDIDRTAQRPR